MSFTEMLDTLGVMFSYGWMQRALIVGALVSLCSALLGVTLVLRRVSMIGDGLSHVGFGAMAIALAIGAAPLPFAVPLVIAAAFILIRVGRSERISGDAAVAVAASGSLAVGLIVISRTSGMNADVSSYMYGSILAMNTGDVVLSTVLSAAVLAMFVLSYNKLFAVTFDESFASATGVRSGLYGTLVAVLTAVTVVVGMRMMGALLISSLVVFPPLAAMRVCRSFRAVTLTSAAIALVSFFVGVSASCLYATPVGASVVAADLAALAICFVIGALRGRFYRNTTAG